MITSFIMHWKSTFQTPKSTNQILQATFKGIMNPGLCQIADR